MTRRPLYLGLATLGALAFGFRMRAAANAPLATMPSMQQATLPASGATADQRLASSPRKGEWVTIHSGSDSVRAWVVYPANRQGAKPVVAIHDIGGMSNWIRAVADQLAADGFIGVAPDLLTMMDLPRDEDGDSDPAAVRSSIGNLDPATRDRFIQAVGEWATKQQGATSKYGIVGFCWGGSTVFAHAVASPAALGAVVVYYGTSPETASLSSVRVPVAGMYGGNDQRVNSTIPPAEEALKGMGRTFEPHIFDGAGHGFLRNQEGAEGANAKAAQQAWPLTLAFLRSHL